MLLLMATLLEWTYTILHTDEPKNRQLQHKNLCFGNTWTQKKT